MDIRKTKTTDRRVRRTKNLLLNGLLRLMQQKHVKDITVRELSDLVDINRGTFYLYYHDIFDMLEQVENELIESFNMIIEAHTADEESLGRLPFLTDLFAFIGENRVLFKVLLSQNGDSAFLQRFSRYIRDSYRLRIRDLRHDDMDETDFDYHYGFVVFGGIGLIHCWLESNCRESPETMAKLADQMIRGDRNTPDLR